MAYMRDARGKRLDSFDVAERPLLTDGQRAITYPEHLTISRRKMAAALYRPFNITCIGNSITFGQYAGDVGTVDQNLLRYRGWVGQLRALFSPRYGTVGEGVIQMADTRVTQSGAQAVASIGVTRATPGGYRLDADADWVEFSTVENAPEVWSHGWWESDAKCPNSFLYTVDGGADQTLTIGPLGTDKDWTAKITGLSDAPHVIRIKGVTGKQLDLAGFQIARPNSNGGGVRLHRLAQSGGYLNTVFFNTGDSGNIRSDRLTLGRPATDLLILAFGVNEASTSGETAGHTPAAYESDLRRIVTYATGTYGCDVLLLSTGRRDPTQVHSAGDEAFFGVHEEIAAENSRVAHLDMKRLWGTYAQASAAGLMYDTVHPRLIGHSHMAKTVFEAVAGV